MDISRFCAKEQGRYALHNTWVSKNRKYATDGCAMIAIPCNEPDTQITADECFPRNQESIIPRVLPIDGFVPLPAINSKIVSCPDCKATGKTQCPECGQCVEQVCDSCNGTKTEIKYEDVVIGNARFSGALLAKFADLPSVAILVRDSELVALIRFDGGAGAVMSMRGRY